jgi:preprotein translocase subunit SecG
MSLIITILIFLVCILLILVVLIQNPKGGGLATGFSSSNQILGVRKTGDFLEKATWTLAISLVVLSLASAMIHAPTGPAATPEIQEQLDAAPFQAPPIQEMPLQEEQ